jgi:methylated-DNA-[protein]-cysteine S-methyltransferase
MRCRTALTRIDALRTGELLSDEQGAVKQHLHTCQSCDESLADVDRLARAVKSIFVAPPRPLRDAMKDSVDRVDDVWVAFSERGIRMISRASLEELRSMYAKRYGRGLMREPIPDALRRQVVAALGGEGVERPRLDLEQTTDLEQQVMETMARIPRGEVRTYSWLAQQVGRPRAVRAVANVVARNVIPFIVPCHRVVPATGGVGKYAYGSKMKRELLKREGVDVDELDTLAREHIRYIGSQTTHIFCFPTCRDARRIRRENRVPFHGAQEAAQKGFRPCQRCQPSAA